ncbi:MAG: S-adenosylmethionine:tRNA ribosyltransferase-isomerase [Fuerstiella sp.]
MQPNGCFRGLPPKANSWQRVPSKRPAVSQEFYDYQTVFTKNIGAVAGPKTSLHFDQALPKRWSPRVCEVP